MKNAAGTLWRRTTLLWKLRQYVTRSNNKQATKLSARFGCQMAKSAIIKIYTAWRWNFARFFCSDSSRIICESTREGNAGEYFYVLLYCWLVFQMSRKLLNLNMTWENFREDEWQWSVGFVLTNMNCESYNYRTVFLDVNKDCVNYLITEFINILENHKKKRLIQKGMCEKTMEYKRHYWIY